MLDSSLKASGWEGEQGSQQLEGLQWGRAAVAAQVGAALKVCSGHCTVRLPVAAGLRVSG